MECDGVHGATTRALSLDFLIVPRNFHVDGIVGAAPGAADHKTAPQPAGSGLASVGRFLYPADMIYIFLVIAIVAEVIATSAMAKSDGFTRIWPSLIAFLGYGLAFYL